MHRQLARDILRRLGATGDIAQRGADVVQTTAAHTTIAHAQHRFGPRLGDIGVEGEAILCGVAEPGQQLGQFAHILLRIGRADAHRMQLHRFAGKVLVQPEPLVAALLRKGRVRATAGVLIQIDQHHRMGFDGEEHILEPAGQMWPDRLVHEGKRQRVLRRTLGAHGEMIRPELHQPLAKAGGVVHRPHQPALQIAPHQLRKLLVQGAIFFFGAGLAGLARLAQIGQPAGQATGLFDAQRLGTGACIGDAVQHRFDRLRRRHEWGQAKAQSDGGKLRKCGRHIQSVKDLASAYRMLCSKGQFTVSAGCGIAASRRQQA